MHLLQQEQQRVAVGTRKRAFYFWSPCGVRRRHAMRGAAAAAYATAAAAAAAAISQYRPTGVLVNN